MQAAGADRLRSLTSPAFPLLLLMTHYEFCSEDQPTCCLTVVDGDLHTADILALSEEHE